MSQENVEIVRRYREAAEAYIDGSKVEAAGVFLRPGGSDAGSDFDEATWWRFSIVTMCGSG